MTSKFNSPREDEVATAPELSPDFTDTARAALLWVLWHHQGGSSPVGQPIRFALGMDAHIRLNARQISEAKRWGELAASTTAPPPVEPSEEQITAALSAAAFFDTPQSRKDMRRALIAAADPSRLLELLGLATGTPTGAPAVKRNFVGRGHLEETGYIPAGSAAEREATGAASLPTPEGKQ
jgi:hypothetical protein